MKFHNGCWPLKEGYGSFSPQQVYEIRKNEYEVQLCAAFGLLSTHSRLHGSTSYRVSWVYDEEAVDVVRFFTRLKLELLPYLYSQGVETVQVYVRPIQLEEDREPFVFQELKGFEKVFLQPGETQNWIWISGTSGSQPGHSPGIYGFCYKGRAGAEHKVQKESARKCC